MNVAVAGTRGIPARYGGFETFAEEISTRLAARGHEVTVYTRDRYYKGPEFNGVHIVKVTGAKSKYADTLSHMATTALRARGHDIVLVCNAANAAFCPLLKRHNAKVVLAVDGHERLRRKWNRAAKLWYVLNERLAGLVADAVVADAGVIQTYYRERLRTETTMIPYGAPVDRLSHGNEWLSRFGLRPRGYFLYVSRLEPENNADLVIEAYRSVKSEMPLVIVGDSPYATSFKEHVKQLASLDPRVILTGGVYGEGYRELLENAHAYIQATEVGGTHPALIEAMGAGNLIIFLDTPENVEVAGGCGIGFSDRAELASAMVNTLNTDYSELAHSAIDRVKTRYSWDIVTDAYEKLFYSLAGGRE